MHRRAKRVGIVGLSVIGTFSVAAVAIPLLTRGPSVVEMRSIDNAVPSLSVSPADSKPLTLKILTLNVAHGRSNGRHQALQSTKTIRSNLDQISELLVREAPDVVALQEADGPAIWSGNFNHVDYLADHGVFAHNYRGEHVKGLRLSYGTALLSRLPLDACASVTFEPSPPTLAKGFVKGSVNWPGALDVEVTLVSVHLDFARASVREKQVRRIITQLDDVQGPVVVMGDFNCQWQGDESSLRSLATDLDLRAYQPTADGMVTFPRLGRRLDWILISPDLEFVSYSHLSETVSDHLGVATELRLATAGRTLMR